MAVLGETSRRELWAEFMRRNDEPTSITKQELRAAVDALDAFFDSNAATINAAIPQPARGSLSASQKAFILSLLLERRYGDRV